MDNQKYAIEVRDLHISYRCLKSFSVKKSFFKLRKSKPEIYEAVRGVSFQVRKGDILGIVGKNGSGKSTLLRALAGIFSPDSGEINLHGYTVSLLAIGVGFQKALSGRENIYLSGMLLGFSEEQIREKIDEIISFAGLGKFIDMPVQTYSSGMYSKLAFSITAILETDIMLIDEVLSVGDAKFKKKSYRKMKDLIMDENRTVIIVSHNSDTIRNLCTSVLWLHEGEVRMMGDTNEVMDAYEEFMQ
ncbi:MAG: ABC transporter ATP-binding protein [Ruminococcus sp.]|jgi:teichoic acid transport system ATP-binding protein